MRRLRWIGRMIPPALALAVVAMVGVQFTRVTLRNLDLARELHETRTQIAALEARRDVQLRSIARLQTARGAIPEIHERLRWTAPNELLIYVKGAGN